MVKNARRIWVAAACLSAWTASAAGQVVLTNVVVQKYGAELLGLVPADGLLLWDAENEQLKIGDGHTRGGKAVCVGWPDWHVFRKDADLCGHAMKFNASYRALASGATWALERSGVPVLWVSGSGGDGAVHVEFQMVDADTILLTADTADESAVVQSTTNLVDAAAWTAVGSDRVQVTARSVFATTWRVERRQGGGFEAFRVVVPEGAGDGDGTGAIHAALPLVAEGGVVVGGQTVTNWADIAQYASNATVTVQTGVSSLNGLTNSVSIGNGSNTTVRVVGQTIYVDASGGGGGGGSGGVDSVNGIVGAVTLAAGGGISIVPVVVGMSTALVFSASGGGSGGGGAADTNAIVAAALAAAGTNNWDSWTLGGKTRSSWPTNNEIGVIGGRWASGTFDEIGLYGHQFVFSPSNGIAISQKQNGAGQPITISIGLNAQADFWPDALPLILRNENLLPEVRGGTNVTVQTNWVNNRVRYTVSSSGRGGGSAWTPASRVVTATSNSVSGEDYLIWMDSEAAATNQVLNLPDMTNDAFTVVVRHLGSDFPTTIRRATATTTNTYQLNGDGASVAVDWLGTRTNWYWRQAY